MGLPQLETCCFVFDLKTGNIIMGSLNAYGVYPCFPLMYPSLFVLGMVGYSTLQVMSFTITIMMTVVACSIAPIQEKAFEERDLEAEAATTGLYVMSIILVLMFLAKFCFDVVFVYGVVIESANIVRAYFFMWTVFFFLSMFTFFLNAPHYDPGTISLEVFYICLNVYAILLSHSFYKQLNNREVV